LPDAEVESVLEIYERLGTRDLRLMGGLWPRWPNLPRMMLFFALASLGLPGLGNFIGEFLILSGTFTVAPWVVAAASAGMIFAVVYSLMLVERAFYGPQRFPANEPQADGSMDATLRTQNFRKCCANFWPAKKLVSLTVATSNGQSWLFKYRDLCIQIANHSLNGSNGLLNRGNLSDFFLRKGTMPSHERDN